MGKGPVFKIGSCRLIVYFSFIPNDFSNAYTFVFVFS